MSTQVTLNNVVLSFNNMFVAKKAKNKRGKETGEPRFTATLLLPEDFNWDPLMDAADEAAQKSFQENVQDDYVVPWQQPEKEAHRQFDGQWWLRTSTPEDSPPTVVDYNVDPLIDRSQIFSGCIVNVQIHLWAYEVEDVGIKCFLDLIQLADNSSDKVKRMDGRMMAGDVFKKIKGAPAATSRPGLGSRRNRDNDEQDEERPSRRRSGGRSGGGRTPSYLNKD